MSDIWVIEESFCDSDWSAKEHFGSYMVYESKPAADEAVADMSGWNLDGFRFRAARYIRKENNDE